MVDWFSVGKAMCSAPLAQQWWVSKHALGHFAHGKNMMKWKFCTMAQCPHCGCYIEDKPHITWCPQEAAKALWHKAIQELKEWMKAEQSDPQIIQDIMN